MEKNQIWGIQFTDSNQVLKNIDENRKERIAIEITHILNDKHFSNETRYNLVIHLVRNWTSINTVNGNYRNTPYWSQNAINKYQQLIKNIMVPWI